MNSITKLLFAALAVIAAGSMFVLGGSTAHAQAPEPPDPAGAGTLLIEKVCVDEEGNPVTGEGPFEIDLEAVVEPDAELGVDGIEDVEDAAEALNTALDATELTIAECGGTLTLGATDYDTGSLGDGELNPIIDFVTDLLTGGVLVPPDILIFDENIASVTLDIIEGGEVQCSFQAFPEGDPTWTDFTEAGIVCQVINVFDLPDLTVVKACPAVDDGTGTFNISVDGDTNVFGCGTSADYDDLPAGEPVTITEVIGGADAGDYVTSIDCDNEADDDASGLTVDVTMEFGEDVTCTVSNVFVGSGLTDEEIEDILNRLQLELELEIEIENILNNINENINTNDNDNTNNNVNENTQNQTNDQNTNVTTGDVNVSSTGGSGSGEGSGGGGVVHVDKPKIVAPNTGSGGLADTSNGSGLSFGAMAAVAGLLGTLSLAAVRFAATRS